ncbi:unnamed protein product [Scytosiphon promiscuus]
MLSAAFVVALSSSPFARVSSFLGTSALLRSAAARDGRRATSTSTTAAVAAVSKASTDATIMSSSPAFIDIGANLLDDVFQGRYHGGSQKHEPDLDAVLERAGAAGVEKMIVTAGTLEESREALKLAKKHPNLYSTVGVHPTRCLEFFGGGGDGEGGSGSGSGGGDPEAHVAALAAVLEEGKAVGKVVAVGECGLDYDRLHFCGKAEQARGFELQFELAERSGLPVFFHSRACREDFAALVRRNRDRVSGGVVHSFTGSKEEAEELTSMGLYIGVNGCSLKTEENLEVLRSIPGDRLMLETDAPWCEIRPSHAGSGMIKTAIPSRKKEKFEAGFCVKGRQEPCHIVQVLEVAAAARGEEPSALAEQALENTRRLFFPGSV